MKNKGKMIMIITIGIMCVILTTVMFMQFKVVEETDITSIETMREAELRTALSEWKTKYEETNKQLEDTNTKITEYEETADDRQETANLIDQELEQTNMILSFTYAIQTNTLYSLFAFNASVIPP